MSCSLLLQEPGIFNCARLQGAYLHLLAFTLLLDLNYLLLYPLAVESVSDAQPSKLPR